MAAPASVTSTNISGIYTSNKTLSDAQAQDQILTYQGVGWLMRTAISTGTLTLTIKHTNQGGVESINIDQAISTGLPGSNEARELDWEPRERNDKVFGHLIARSRRVKLEEVEDEFLKSGWLEEANADGLINVYSTSDTAKSNTTWTAEQTWGFQVVKGEGLDPSGERRYVRLVRFVGPKGEKVNTRLVYDYVKAL